jgi:hypothetical protein
MTRIRLSKCTYGKGDCFASCDEKGWKWWKAKACLIQHYFSFNDRRKANDCLWSFEVFIQTISCKKQLKNTLVWQLGMAHG